jgi:hypothetical protein
MTTLARRHDFSPEQLAGLLESVAPYERANSLVAASIEITAGTEAGMLNVGHDRRHRFQRSAWQSYCSRRRRHSQNKPDAGCCRQAPRLHPTAMLSLGDQGAAALTSADGPFSPLPTAFADDELSRGIAWARRLMQNNRAASTREKYTRDWALFVRWLGAAKSQLDPCPAVPASVGPYIGVLRGRGLTKGTILARVAAINYVHELAGAPSPVDHAELKRDLKGLRREVDEDRQERPAIERDLATELASRMLQTIRAQSLDKRLLDQRDVAIFTLGWLSALRRSSISALRRRDVVIKREDLRHTRYLEIFVAKSKTIKMARAATLLSTSSRSLNRSALFAHSSNG